MIPRRWGGSCTATPMDGDTGRQYNCRPNRSLPTQPIVLHANIRNTLTFTLAGPHCGAVAWRAGGALRAGARSNGRGRLSRGGEKDAVFQGLIQTATTAFWDAYLKGDARAKAFLTGGGFEKVLGKDGTFEKKRGRISEK